jgi:hypothetical protein
MVGAVGLTSGYMSGVLRKLPQIDDPKLIRYVRSEQMKTLFGKQSIWRSDR